MQKTKNHQLNQWDETDRILREDFNRDNALVDTALTNTANAISTETANRKQADGALQSSINQHSIMVPLKTITTTAQATVVNVDISGIDWGSYNFVIAEIESKGYGDGSVSLNSSGSYHMVIGNSGYGMSYASFNSHGFLNFFVFRNPNATATCISLFSGMGYGMSSTCYNSITTMNFVASNDRYYLSAGSVIRFWGVK